MSDSESKLWPFDEVREGVVSKVYLMSRSQVIGAGDSLRVPERTQFVNRKLRHRQRKGMCAMWQNQWEQVGVDADGKYFIMVLSEAQP